MYLKIHRSVKRPWQRPCSGVIRCGLCPIFVDTSGIESVNFVWFSKSWCKFVISPVVHLLRWNGHRKRILSIFSKTTTRVEIIENAGLSYLCGRTKMEEVLFQSFYRFRVDSQNYSNTPSVYTFFSKTKKKSPFSKISGYVWRGRQTFVKMTYQMYSGFRVRERRGWGMYAHHSRLQKVRACGYQSRVSRG